MSEHGASVFISYHRSDLAVAEKVRAHLTANRISTWMDQYDIPAGAYWPDEIDKGLSKSTFVVGLLSPDSVDSRNVKNEWDWALQNGKHLILLMARSCVIPHRYVSINFIDATSDDASAALDALMRTPGLRPAQPAFKVPRTRYALSNGLSVAWQEYGSGELDLVYVPGFISHVEQGWKSPLLAEHLTRFGTLARILKFDKRGTGMSDRSAGIPTMEERIDDIRAVMDAAGSERAVLYGYSQGAPLAVLFAVTYPERTRGIIFCGGSATYVSRPDYPWQRTREEWNALIAEEEATFPERWGTMELAREGLRHYGPSRADDEAEVAFWAEYARLAASPGAVIAMNRMDLEVDVRGILGAIRVPTIDLHRVGELDADIGEARYVAARIPGAILRELEGDDHLAHYGDQDAFFGAIEEFLETLKRPTPSTRERIQIPQTRYALSNGLSVAWQEFGAGDTDIVYVPGFISHVEHSWRYPPLAEHLLRFGSLGRVLKFDKRGTGMSDRAAGIPTLEERMDDVRAVMDAAGSERGVIFGLSEGVPLSILFAAMHPERTRGLILFGGSATSVRQADYPWQQTLEVGYQQIAEDEAMLPEQWGTIAHAREVMGHFAPSAANDNELIEWFAEYLRLGASPGAAIALTRMNLEVDVRGILSAVRVPTLVMHRVGDRDANLDEGRYIAERIPGAVFRELPGDDHFPHIGDQEPFFDAIERFLDTLGAAADAEPESVLATVVRVATSNVDLASVRHDLDRLLHRFRGRAISLDGDGVLAAFDGPARAIRFAHGMIELPHEDEATIRAGVQSGEVLLDDSSAAGPPVEIATHLAELAQSGQVLATGTVRDLVAGSGIRFHEARAEQSAAFPDGPVVLIVDQESVD